MQIGLRQFENDVVEWFKSASVSGDYTRSALARRLCELSEWRNSTGDLCEAQARKILPRLAGELSVALPAVSDRVALPDELEDYADGASISCELARLGRVSVELVEAGSVRKWRSMMHTHHPRGEPHIPGKAVKYWVETEHCGRLGGLSFHAASWHEGVRDRYIGWSQRARVEHLSLVVNNARFLILPGVRVHGLASVVLDLAAKRVCEDWQRVYGEAPVLAYTHIDASHSGQSYRAAGWRRIGETSGRRCSAGHKKQVYALALSDDWQARLCCETRRRFRPVQAIYLKDDAHWTDVEYGASTHPDGRVGKRIVSMGRAWQCAPGKSTPEVFASDASRKAAYRLLSSDNVGMDDILESHRQATVARCAQREVVLAVQDTTAINYDTQKDVTSGLTTIGGTARGIYAHANVAFSPGGRVLGVLDMDGGFRSRCAASGDELKESVRWVEGLETAAELSVASGARVISVCDREGDLWTMFERQRELQDQVGLLVRHHGSRRRKVVGDQGDAEDLRQHVEGLVAVGSRQVHIEAQGGKRARKARVATVTLRIAKVSLKAPGDRAGCVPVVAVSVIEEHAAVGVKVPLNWFLLCTEGGADVGNAVRICQWYEARWGIEEYFRALKTGCQVEERQFDDVEDLMKCLAFDAITAWRVFDLQRVAKKEPDRLAAEVVEPDELEVCQLLLHEVDRRCPIRPPPELTILDYVVGLGRIAGFSPTRRQPVPGTKKLWQATTTLMISIQAINYYKATLHDDANDGQNTVSSASK